jgi:hypothetical protein
MGHTIGVYPCPACQAWVEANLARAPRATAETKAKIKALLALPPQVAG